MSKSKKRGDSPGKQTLAIRCQLPRSQQREHSVPVYLTSSFVFDDAEYARSLFAREREGNNYGRYHAPNVAEFTNKMASLEEAETGVGFATGMAALFTAIMAHSKSGQKIVASRCLFGSTVQILTRLLPQWGMSCAFVDNTAPMDAWARELDGDTSLCLIETPSNPTLDVTDIAALAEVCRAREVPFLVDNAYGTPFLQNPIGLGADMVMHSATKYIDGQGRSMGGVVVGSKKHLGPLNFMLRHTGPSLSPFNAWLLSKSLEHLQLRMERHCDNAEKLVSCLAAHPKVARVLYPFAADNPGEAVARRQMRRGGGMLSFVVKGATPTERRRNAYAMLDGLKMCSLSANLGDTRTIVTHPSTTTHSSLNEEERERMGIDEGMIRVSVGLEDSEDILADFDDALGAMPA